MSKGTMDKCKRCKNYDKERSDRNWVVCPVIPLVVILSGDSSNCVEFVPLEKADGK